MWEVSSGNNICTIKHEIPNPDIYLSPNSKIVLIKSGDGKRLRWWNTLTKKPIINEIELERSYRDVYYSPNSKRIFIAGYSARSDNAPGKVSIKVFDAGIYPPSPN